MKIDHYLIDRLLVMLLVLAVCFPFISWMLSAFGVHCNSMLSGDGWRWLFLNTPGCAVNRHTINFVSLLTMVGSIHLCGMFSSRATKHSVALGLSLSTGFLLLCALAFAALYPQSPLLSITGRFYHSALAYGLPFAISMVGIAVASVFCIVSGRVTSLHSYVEMLTWGCSRYVKLIVLFIQVEYIRQCLLYILHT